MVDDSFARRLGELHPPNAGSSLYKPGLVVDGWRLTAFIGRGGSGEVYRAEATKSADAPEGTAAALKFLLHPENRQDVKRFTRETELLRLEPHRCLPHFLSDGEYEGRPYLATEYLQPLDLPSRDADVARFLLDICDGVAFLHALGFVHRDIKPANILARDGRPVLIDCGLVKDLAKPAVSATSTVSVVDGHAVGVGTPGYAAPEQFDGGGISPATDVHALGILADQCFNDRPPRCWRTIIQRATSSIPALRYPTIESFRRAVKYRHFPSLRTVGTAALVAVLAWRVCASAFSPPPSMMEKPDAGLEVRKLLEDPVRGLLDSLVEIPGTNFLMGRYEVMQGQWEAVMGTNPAICQGEHLYRHAEHPIENVSWAECQTFLRKLNAHPYVVDGDVVFRLPTEEEWEYACRAGGTGPYGLLMDGSDVTERNFDEVAWYRANSFGETHPAGRKMPNAFGLCDMHGNVSEYVVATRSPYEELVKKGGSFLHKPAACAVDQREAHAVDKPGRNVERGHSSYMGFRLCATKSDAAAAGRAALDRLSSEMVEIPNAGLLMSKYEVTQALWQEIMGNNPSGFKGLRRPVESVNWHDCQAFLKRLNERPEVRGSGLVYRLPTAGEWEYCARAGGKGRYGCRTGGREETIKSAHETSWCLRNAMLATHAVGRKPPNDFGLHDMLGNVCELTATVTDDGLAVLRGGSWSTDTPYNSVDLPFSAFHDTRQKTNGFRLCATRIGVDGLPERPRKELLPSDPPIKMTVMVTDE